jgi:YD repeat-containing protein
MGQISYSYDENGNASQRTDPNGRQITFSYDVSGQLAAEYTVAGPTGSAETH